MEIGRFNLLTVMRETDISYILTDGKEEVFLHKKEALKAYEPGDTLEVFLYVDNRGRTTASTRIPYIAMEEAAFLQVVSVNFEFGVFLDNNLIKDLLLSKDDLPFNLDEWPKPQDMIFVQLREKKGTLFAKFVGRKQIGSYFLDKVLLESGKSYQAYVQYLLDDGLICFTPNGDEIFIHVNNTRRKYRLGEEVHPRILKQNESLEYVGSLIEQKETMIKSDADIILDYLDSHEGLMRFTDKSNPVEIQAAFKMSKSAFKRALGSLYKAGRVELGPENTRKIKS